MIKIENTQVVGLEPALRGMRNPMNSWNKSDSFCDDKCSECSDNQKCAFYFSERGTGKKYRSGFYIGPNDEELMLKLASAGPVHGKFRRMIIVYVDITAPLYWWKEFDTYKVRTVANSCSTMHKIAAKEFTLDDFSNEHLINCYAGDDTDCWVRASEYSDNVIEPFDVLKITIQMLNKARTLYLEYQERAKTGDQYAIDHVKDYWWQMIQLLPSSYNQKRTVMLSYEVLAGMHPYGKDHKQDEWRIFDKWILDLPNSKIITCSSDKQPEGR